MAEDIKKDTQNTEDITNVNTDDDTAEMAVKPDYEGEIISVIRSNDSPRVILKKLEDYHGNDIAGVIADLTKQERQKLYRVCSGDMLAEAFEYLDEDDAGTYLNEMDLNKAAAVVSLLETDTAVNVLREIEREKRGLIIDALSAEVRKEIRLIASFDEDEIGSKMTTNCIIIKEDLTIKQAMSELVRQAEDNDNITTIFVVDDNEEFYGAIDLKELITARSTRTLESLIMTSFPYVYANEEIDECIEKLKDYSEDLIPVLDNSSRLLGVITAKSLIEVVDDEMGEDYVMFAGLTAEEDLQEPLLQSMKKRLPWLLVLLCLGMLVSGVVGAFEQIIAELTLIQAFQSLILDMAGNVGTQSLAVTIRVLTDENLTLGQKLHLVAKETRVGISNGIILGVMSFGLVGLYIMFFKHRTPGFSFAVSGCIGVSLMLAMLISSAVGTIIPLFFKKIKVDPAVASGPLITTVNDLVAVVTYYGLSWILLLNVMHLGG
ncbi:magnesium transporter [Ruminococcus sp.]|uniref:magnesium transporter n=1 Tax=Ruminococcus sp. TaxID=41978 RepID=UPI0025FF9CB8|nr:magnesium transporter [Ruminococcus sp.]